MKGERWWVGMERAREILRLFEQGANKTEIARAVGVTRATVRDYLTRAAAGGLAYADTLQMSESELLSRFEKSSPGRKIKDKTIDHEWIKRELSRKGVTLLLLWEEYLREHPDGYSYSQFCERYGEWRKDRKTPLRREYPAGKFLFVDYAGMKMPITDRASGDVRHVAVFVAALGASHKLYAEATDDQKLSNWLESHVRAFEFFGGVPEVVVPDNLKSAVLKACRYDPELNPSYRELAEHYNLAVVPARPYKPQDKAKVETGVRIVEERILASLRDRAFYSLAELNAAIKELLAVLNARPMKIYGKCRDELFIELDFPALKPLPVSPYRFAEWKRAKVNIDYHIEFARHYYSVPYQFRHQEVWIRASARNVEVFKDGERIAYHLRDDNRARHTTKKEHMPPSHQYMADWNPVRFLDWAATIGKETRAQVAALLGSREHPEQAFRACLGLLRLSKQFGTDRLEAACLKANALGIASFKSVKSMLETGRERVNENKSTRPCLTHRNIRGTTQFH